MPAPERIIGDYEYRWECPSCHKHFGCDVMEDDGPCPKCGADMDDAERSTRRPIREKRYFIPPFEVVIGWERKEPEKKQIRSSQDGAVREFRECLEAATNPMEPFEERLDALDRMVELGPLFLPPEREDYCQHDCDTGAGCSHQTREKKP